LSFNPAFDKSIDGLSESQGLVFSPNVRVQLRLHKKIAGGFEYYGSVGPATNFDSIAQQQRQFFPAIGLNHGQSGKVTLA
jgi:hypothetical protein